MAIGTEYVFPLEELAKRQQQIYPDACDVGVWEDQLDLAQVRWCLEGLKKLEGGKAERWTNGCSFTSRLGFEREADRCVGVVVRVSKNVTRSGKAFYSFDITRSTWPWGSRLSPE